VPGSFYNQSWSFNMSKKIWDGLSKADQKAIDAVSGEAITRDAGSSFDSKAKAAKAKLKADGMQMVEASPAFVTDLKKGVCPACGEFSESRQGKRRRWQSRPRLFPRAVDVNVSHWDLNERVGPVPPFYGATDGCDRGTRNVYR
jgi:hypothetical protein